MYEQNDELDIELQIFFLLQTDKYQYATMIAKPYSYGCDIRSEAICCRTYAPIPFWQVEGCLGGFGSYPGNDWVSNSGVNWRLISIFGA